MSTQRPLSKEGLRDRLALAEGRLISSIRQRDELLAALHSIDERLSDGSSPKIRSIARAAIAKTEGQS